MNTREMGKQEITKAAYDAIEKELGTEVLIRFMQYSDKSLKGDYVKDKDNLNKKFTVRKIYDDVMNQKKNNQK